MLRTFRKFSSSLFAKIFLFIVAIPFVFWGMGPLFTGGNLNTIVQIDRDKIATKEFISFLQVRVPNDEMLDIGSIEKLLSSFIGQKLINEEIDHFNIRLSDRSLSTIIKNDKTFKKNDKFSRTEYEKFLVKNSLNAVTLENNISRLEKKNQLLDFIGAGVVPPEFMVNTVYNNINQKRDVELISLNDSFKKNLSFSEEQVNSYYNENKNNFIDVIKSVKFIKLDPNSLTNNNEFSDLYFQKIDEIDDLIVEGKKLDFISSKFNLENINTAALSKISNTNKNFPVELTNKVFSIHESEPVVLFELNDNYFVVELIKTENSQRKISDRSVNKEIVAKLEQHKKRELITQIIAEINDNKFKKDDFNKFSLNQNVPIKKIKLENKNDEKILNKNLVNQIYLFPEKKVIIIADIGFSQSYLVYIDKVTNVNINRDSDNYNKYAELSKAKMRNSLYDTYDKYLKKKYDININYKALDSINSNSR